MEGMKQSFLGQLSMKTRKHSNTGADPGLPLGGGANPPGGANI